jgi:hypothetical protein
MLFVCVQAIDELADGRDLNDSHQHEIDDYAVPSLSHLVIPTPRSTGLVRLGRVGHVREGVRALAEQLSVLWWAGSV